MIVPCYPSRHGCCPYFQRDLKPESAGPSNSKSSGKVRLFFFESESLSSISGRVQGPHKQKCVIAEHNWAPKGFSTNDHSFKNLAKMSHATV